MGVTIPQDVGRRRARLRQLRARASRRSRRPAPSLAVIAAVNNSLVAEPIAQFGTRRAEAARGCAGSRRATSLGAFALSEEHAGIGRGEPADRARASTTRLRASTAARSGSPTPRRRTCVDRVRRDAARHARPRHQRVPRAARHARHHARRRAPIRSACAAWAAWISRCTTCASRPTRCSARPGEGFRIAMWALDGGRVAIAAQALGVGRRRSTRRWRTRRRARRSASRSATTRRSSGCWPTWRPSSTRRGC